MSKVVPSALSPVRAAVCCLLALVCVWPSGVGAAPPAVAGGSARGALPAGVWVPEAAARELGVTAPNDTLWQIARRVQAPGLTPHQVMVALARRNPQAFVGGNMFWLRVGVPLVLPSRAELLAEPATPSEVLVATHRRAWQAGRALAPDWSTVPRAAVRPAEGTADPAVARPSAAPSLPPSAPSTAPAPAPAPALAPAAVPVAGPVPAVSLPVLPPPEATPAVPPAAGSAAAVAGSAANPAAAGTSTGTSAGATTPVAEPAPAPAPIAAVLPPRGLDASWLWAPFALLLAGGGLLWWWRLGRGDGFARTEPASPPASARAPASSTTARALAAAAPAAPAARPAPAPAPAPAAPRPVATPSVAAGPTPPGRPTTAAVWQAATSSPVRPSARADGESELELLVAKAYLELGQAPAAREWLDALAAHAPVAVREEAARLLRWNSA
ncbi:FimV/HubP family polar landmark protein [Pseudaquabacterium rugosum]|uniref:FimV/HubP family polar landmark protein n=1 Tax=Pseudaquabacterium rugosum TaxID=2984194 RepID=A0ABU9BB59_9BURK